MNVPEQTPLLRITSLSYSDSGEFLNYSVMFRNASVYQVDYHLRRVRAENPLTYPQNSTASSCGVIIRKNMTSG